LCLLSNLERDETIFDGRLRTTKLKSENAFCGFSYFLFLNRKVKKK